jgi:DNA-binding SARP family transcriptional activator
MSIQHQKQEPASLRVSVLGPMVVYRPDGSRVSGALWGRTKVRCLLALFVLHDHHYMHREEIIRLLWPDIPRKAALGNLNNTIYSLRKCLEPNLASGSASHYIGYQQGGYYALNDRLRCWLDICRFQACLREAQRTRAVSEASRLYEEAINLYRGDLLAGLTPIAPLFMDKRVRLRTLYCDAMEDLAALREHEEREDDAIALYLKVLALDPRRDSAAMRLLKLALIRDDKPAVRTHYRSLREALQ